MSLLLQALQKAAKNREDGGNEGGISEPSETAELALEPVAEPDIGEEIASAPATSPAQAATVMRAAETPQYTPIDWMRDHYMLSFLGGAILFAIGYGLYVYIQISNPGFLRRSVPAASTPLKTVAAPVVPAAETAAKISGMPDEMGSIPTGTGESRPAADRSAGATAPANEPAAVSDKPKASAGDRTRIRRPRAESAMLADAARNPPAQSAGAEDGIEVVEIPASPSIATVATPRLARDEISVRRQASGITPVAPKLLLAYEALQQGDYAKSRTLYMEVLGEEPRNIDALLGVAAIAWKQGRTDEASRHYSRVLDLEPRNTHAQAGLIAMLGVADPVAAETRLKQLIDREPSGFLYFTLGNLYAEQGKWPSAQNAYFQAVQFQPANPDYAFNLAVGLEHLGKTNLALDYYRKALDLSFKKGRANFDQSLAIERVGQLSARVE